MSDNDIEPYVETTALQEERKTLQNEIDMKNDQIYDLKNQIALIKEREVHYLHEINLLQSNEGSEVNKLHEKIKQLEQECLKLKNNSCSELSKYDDEISQLEKELELLLSENDKSSNTRTNASANDIFDENLLLEKELQTLQDEVMDKQLYMEQLQKRNLKLSEPMMNAQMELEELNESINCKKQTISETNDLINTLEEEMFMSKQELDSLKVEYKEYSDSQNSLFGEVNNKRLKVQEVLLDLTQKCDKMKLEISSKQKQISALRLHNDELATIVKNDEIEYKTGQKVLIETYNSRINTLKNLAEKYKNIIVEMQQLSSLGLPNNIVEFLNNLIENKKKTEEKVNEEIGMEFRMRKMISLQLKEAYLKLQEWKETIQQLRSKYLEYSEAIQKLKQKNDNSLVENNKRSKSKEKEGIDNTSIEDKENVENIKLDINTKELVGNVNEKKVTFAADTKISSGNHIVRRGGKIIQSKSIHIPSLKKK